MLIEEPGLFQRARRRLTETSDAAYRRLRPREIAPNLPQNDVARLSEEIRLCVSPSTGEMTARTHARNIGEHYLGLDSDGRSNFFRLLARDFGPDRVRLDAAIATRAEVLAQAPVDRPALIAAERQMRQALRSPREALFNRFNALDDGIKFVVDLRHDLRQLKGTDPQFAAMDSELKDLLSSWFDVGNLDLVRINWDTPASMLEKLIEYESVHEIESWDDLRNRLEPDRRCYAFFHPGMPQEPLIFVEVALVKGLADNVDALLDIDAPTLDPAEADTAIFYSISNCQPGLAGVKLGNLLIKQVVTDLSQTLPNLSVFSTLSPIPGFRTWLGQQLELLESPLPVDRSTVEDTEQYLFAADLGLLPFDREELRRLASGDGFPAKVNAASEPLLRLCAQYLVTEKRRGGAHDRVANFHLSNGARIGQLNWAADSSASGVKQSLGIMANYVYVSDDIPRLHDAYVTNGDIAVSSKVKRLLTN